MILATHIGGHRPPDASTNGIASLTTVPKRAFVPTVSPAGPARIRSLATSCGRCGGCNASRSRSRPSCSPRSGAHRSARQALPAWWSARAPRPSWGSRHPHMLRHACGYTLANKGHDTRALQAYLGHKNIQHTVRYTELSPTRFKDFWRR
ncbi:MAG TPA: tyrosine-type recombinase/integrase [Pseudolabrys sp.]